MKKNDLIMMAREILEAAGSKRGGEADIREELSPERQQTETSTIGQFE